MIQKLIDAELLKEQDSRKGRKGSGKWKPSMLGRCYRAHYWARKGEEQTNPPDIRTLRVFKVGKLFHEFVQGYLPEKCTEVEVNDENVYGFADIVGQDTVYDIKSQHSRAFWYMKKDGYDVKKEKYTNWLQVMCYAKMLGKKKGCLMFVSKDDLCVEEYVDFTENWEEELTKEFTTLNAIWEQDILPAPEPRAYSGKECTYCNFKDKCKEEDGHKEAEPNR